MPSNDAGIAEALEMAERLGIGLMRSAEGRTIADANPAAARLLKLREGALRGKTLMEAFLDHRVPAIVGEAARGGSRSVQLKTPGDANAVLELRAWRGREGWTWIAIQDVTELHRLRRIRAEFIDNLAHELRTPLASVRLLSEGLAMELEHADVPPRAREIAVKIDVESARLAQMVTELLDLAAIEQGEAPLRIESLDLAQVLANVLDRLRPQAEGTGVRLNSTVSEASGPAILAGDRESIGRLVQNLVDNAIKFSPRGAEVTVSLHQEESQVLVEVADQGPGIPERDRDRVFERFYKVDRARGGPGGTGLGLSIARHIAERHGGRIWVESREGVGSTFFVALPRRTAGGQAAG